MGPQAAPACPGPRVSPMRGWSAIPARPSANQHICMHMWINAPGRGEHESPHRTGSGPQGDDVAYSPIASALDPLAVRPEWDRAPSRPAERGASKPVSDWRGTPEACTGQIAWPPASAETPPAARYPSDCVEYGVRDPVFDRRRGPSAVRSTRGGLSTRPGDGLRCIGSYGTYSWNNHDYVTLQ